MFITVDIALQPGFIDVASTTPVQINTITLRSHLKNPDATDPQGFADTQINSYTVHFRRTDGGSGARFQRRSGARSRSPLRPGESARVSPARLVRGRSARATPS